MFKMGQIVCKNVWLLSPFVEMRHFPQESRSKQLTTVNHFLWANSEYQHPFKCSNSGRRVTDRKVIDICRKAHRKVSLLELTDSPSRAWQFSLQLRCSSFKSAAWVSPLKPTDSSFNQNKAQYPYLVLCESQIFVCSGDIYATIPHYVIKLCLLCLMLYET